ncbi:helix-turn-helix transcriptional regulator [Rubritalea spongiae]|uniref:Helix-turn-helix transcriptional regulator n=1 Tax=Rubritalea spongiae TaxID=430797 RepID=A0ABW5E1P5_9BACT
MTRNLHGNLDSDGFCLLHCSSKEPVDLAQDALHFVLNLNGMGVWMSQQLRINLVASTLAVFHYASNDQLIASRIPSEDQDSYVILSVTKPWIKKSFGSRAEALHPSVKSIIFDSQNISGTIGKVRSMSLREKEIANEFVSPPVPSAAQAFWYPAKIFEILTLHLFAPPTLNTAEPFCSQIKRQQSDRIDKAINWLNEHLDESLNLQAIAAHAGCAPHYLSRQFKKHTGMTLKQKHRELRIDHAAQLLLDGDFNVTEAALEVGYSSLSHFSKAFQEVKGERPSEFLQS